MNYTQSQIDLANETNLVSFLSAQGEEVFKSGREYRWKAHDSVRINHKTKSSLIKINHFGSIQAEIEKQGRSFAPANLL